MAAFSDLSKSLVRRVLKWDLNLLWAEVSYICPFTFRPPLCFLWFSGSLSVRTHNVLFVRCRYHAKFMKFCENRLKQGEAKGFVLVESRTGVGIRPSRWPTPSRIPRPSASSAAGLFDILPATVSNTPTCQPRSATATKRFQWVGNIATGRFSSYSSGTLERETETAMEGLPHITVYRWHLWRTPACWVFYLFSPDSSGPKVKQMRNMTCKLHKMSTKWIVWSSQQKQIQEKPLTLGLSRLGPWRLISKSKLVNKKSGLFFSRKR